MTLIEIVALIIFLFPLAFSPGPGNMFFAANGARFGFAKTLSANFGYHLATIIICLLYTSPSPRDRSVSRMPSSA